MIFPPSFVCSRQFFTIFETASTVQLSSPLKTKSFAPFWIAIFFNSALKTNGFKLSSSTFDILTSSLLNSVASASSFEILRILVINHFIFESWLLITATNSCRLSGFSSFSSSSHITIIDVSGVLSWCDISAIESARYNLSFFKYSFWLCKSVITLYKLFFNIDNSPSVLSSIFISYMPLQTSER